MWFHLGCENFIAKRSLKNEFCDIFVSDFVCIWHKTLSNNELMSISQVKKLKGNALNPLLEASMLKHRDIILDSLEDVRAQKDIKKENNKITLKLVSNVLKPKFQFQVSLNEGDSKMFFEEFTLPLLTLLKNMRNRENTLMEIIEDKDEEIAEHKRECGHSRSWSLTTKPFINKELSGLESEKTFWNIGSWLDCIKFPSIEKFDEVEPMEFLEEEEEKSSQIKKCDGMQSASKDKVVTRKKCSKPCVTLDNQIVKKREKNAVKLRF